MRRPGLDWDCCHAMERLPLPPVFKNVDPARHFPEPGLLGVVFAQSRHVTMLPGRTLQSLLWSRRDLEKDVQSREPKSPEQGNGEAWSWERPMGEWNPIDIENGVGHAG